MAGKATAKCDVIPTAEWERLEDPQSNYAARFGL